MTQSEIFELLIKGSSQLGMSLTKGHALSFYQYLIELRAWGRKMNLISRSADREIVIKDFLDSITAQEHFFRGASLLDLGSGAGFPGIPLKIVRADLKVVLLELMQKKVYFLKNVVRVLDLGGIEIYRAGEKEVEKNLWGKFDFVISRALGSLDKFAVVALPFLKQGGILLAMKGKKGEDELGKTLPVLVKMGLNVILLHRFRLPILGHQRILIGFQQG
jgi:16S rRNA (guanine527-N7)-methyltransferase